jgi:hypothetical protein
VIELDVVLVEDHSDPSFAPTRGGGLPLQCATRAVDGFRQPTARLRSHRPLLYNVSQLVRQKPTAWCRIGLVLTRSEDEQTLVAERRLELSRRIFSYPAEIVTEAGTAGNSWGSFDILRICS